MNWNIHIIIIRYMYMMRSTTGYFFSIMELLGLYERRQDISSITTINLASRLYNPPSFSSQ